MRVDLAVYDRYQRLVLVVEVKKRSKVSEKWAAQTRRNLVDNGYYPTSLYFLLATPEKFFLWKPSPNSYEESLPDFSEDAERYLKPHLNELGFRLSDIDEYVFEQVVAQWLKYDVMYPVNKVSKSNWLSESGLSEKIFHGKILSEAIVL